MRWCETCCNGGRCRRAAESWGSRSDRRMCCSLRSRHHRSRSTGHWKHPSVPRRPLESRVSTPSPSVQSSLEMEIAAAAARLARIGLRNKPGTNARPIIHFFVLLGILMGCAFPGSFLCVQLEVGLNVGCSRSCPKVVLRERVLPPKEPSLKPDRIRSEPMIALSVPNSDPAFPAAQLDLSSIGR